MKVGIATIAQAMNYGQRLQNYAVEQILESLGVESETVLLDSGFLLNKKQRLILKLNSVLKRDKWETGLRPLKFDEFNKKNLHFSEEQYPNGNFDKYDYIICGSDQIWNLTVKAINRNKDFYFGKFVDSSKRIAYSASIGVDSLEDDKLKEIASLVNEMKAVSVRELSAKKMIGTVTDKYVSVTVDPVLMLDADKWNKICKKPEYIKDNEKFILMYFLGPVSSELNSYMKTVSEQLGMRIIRLKGDAFESGDDYKMFSTDPSEFVWLIKNSAVVFTDSFHGCAFSSVFRKPFRWFSRSGGKTQNMNCRMESFFSI